MNADNSTQSDVAQRLDHEKNILRMSQMYRTLTRSNRAIAHDRERGTLFSDICRIAVETGNFSMAWIGLLDKASGEIRTATQEGGDASMLQRQLEPATAAGAAIREGRTYICNDLSANTGPEPSPAIRGQARSMAALPLHENHDVAGALVLYTDEAGFFTPALVELLEEMAQDIFFAMQKLADDEKREAMAQALRESEERWSFALDGSGDGVWDWNTQTNQMFYSSGYWNILGFAPGETDASVEDFDARMHPEDKPGVLDSTVQLFRGELPDFCREYRLRCKDGSYKWVLSRGKVVSRSADGQPVRVIGTIEDITVRKSAEANLQLAAQVFQRSSEAIIVTDRDNAILSVNPAFTGVTGYTPDEVIGRNPRIFSSGRHDRAFYQKMWGSLLTTGHWHGEVWNRRKNGDIFPEWLSITAVHDDSGQVSHHIAIFSDIGEIKRAQTDLQLAAQVFESSSEAITITDHDNRILSVNRAFTEVTGYTPDEVTGRNPRMFSSGRHDRAFYQKMWNSLLTTGHWRGEIWNRRKNGDIYPEWLSITAVRDDSGQVSHYIGMFSDISEIKRTEERIHQLANYDALTGLPNRDLFQERIGVAISSAQRNRSPLALLSLDLDRIKQINESFGHAAGDQLLKVVAERLREIVPAQSAGTHHGGDVFHILLPGLDMEGAGHMAQSIINDLSQPYLLDGNEVMATPSIGISVFPNDGTETDVLIQNAEAAMFRAKGSGRRGYQFFAPEMNARSLQRMTLENSLRRALEQEEFLVYYLPQADLKSGQVVGAEALLRWQHPEMGMVSSQVFIEMAEESGVIVPLGEWMMRNVCRQIQAWQQAGVRAMPISINISFRQFRQFRQIEDILRESGINPFLLEIELTESTIMHDVEETAQVIHRIKQHGIRVAVDNFGVGYSTLAYLKRFHIDKLKIDQSFIRELVDSADDSAIVRAIISMAHSLRLEVVAKSVETQKQLDFLKALNCDQIQGYLFSEALPPEDFATLLLEEKRLA
ncbi:MAG TPA: EAL domain-containing protein [Novimethylophilus sp.]|jgi:diguanylate cyclase (GGDEF)-like protein/PAS domain S-box-containing protein|uniref:bifunctional diguanylate cyclase/phosphodiesterase n=1 Tax=Novimethylophilus sp. TaxID=2137426 RepID=UPI002F3EDC94